MNVSEQGARPDRHLVIPRTLVFLTSRNATGQEVVLLLRGAPAKRLWANKYNGLGGHVEAGEDVHEAALRELIEETGITPAQLRLRGVVHVDTGYDDAGSARPGVMIFVFHGTSELVSPTASAEGQAEWIPLDEVTALPAVDDLSDLLVRALRQDGFFFGRYRPLADGALARDYV